jgi:hypothetical protein
MTTCISNAPDKSYTLQRVGSLLYLPPFWSVGSSKIWRGTRRVWSPNTRQQGTWLCGSTKGIDLLSLFTGRVSGLTLLLGKPADGEDEVLKVHAPSSELTLTVNMLRNAVWNALETGKDVYNLWSYECRRRSLGSDWARGSEEEVVYGLEIHATKGLVGVIGWCKVPLYGDAKIEGAKIVEATDSMEGIAIPEGYQVIEVPERTRAAKRPI